MTYVEIIDAATGVLIERRDQDPLPHVGKRTLVRGKEYQVTACDPWADGRYEGAIIEVACGSTCSGVDNPEALPTQHRSKRHG